MALSVLREIHRRIKDEGRITFAQFMDLALYWPNGGYYSVSSPTGPRGDFYTAPGAHPSFGALLSVQLYQMWLLLDRPRPFWVVEAGAGNGLLCHDSVSFARHLPEDFQRSLRYLCLDARNAPGVEANLPDNARSLVQRLAARSLPMTGVVGCVISNELLDSFPVHRVEMRGGRLLEVYVTLKGGELKEELEEPSTGALEERLDRLSIKLPEGCCAEVNLAMEPWLQETAQVLERGYLLTIDYGREATELYSEARSRGTLTTFYHHTQTDNPYMHVGEQDITAQVDFTTLMCLGRELGLKSLGYLTQGRFLINLGIRRLMARLTTLGLGQQERDSNRMGMMELIRPGGMGEFKVLLQGKNAPGTSLWGVEASAELEGLLQELPVPLLTSLHMPLLQGRYPHAAMDFEGEAGL